MVAGGVLALVALLQGSAVVATLAAPPDPANLRNVRTELIRWIDANLPAGQPIASWNAGQFGYFLERPVVNVDGLVNDAEFFHSLRSQEPLAQYLSRQGIRFVVDYNDRDLSMPYRASWDKARIFRDSIPMHDVDCLQTRTAGDRTLYVLRLKSTSIAGR